MAELLLASNDRHAEAAHRSMSTFWLHNLTGEAVEFWASTQPPPGVKWLPETRGWGRLALPVALTAEADPQGGSAVCCLRHTGLWQHGETHMAAATMADLLILPKLRMPWLLSHGLRGSSCCQLH